MEKVVIDVLLVALILGVLGLFIYIMLHIPYTPPSGGKTENINILKWILYKVQDLNNTSRLAT